MTRIVPASPTLSEAIALLRGGEIVAYPTETFYGLGVDARNDEAVRALQKLKNRSQGKPFLVILPSAQALAQFVEKIPPAVHTLIEHFWPGPLTLILKATNLSPLLAGSSGGVGFRVSSHPLARRLAEQFGGCITGTSANPADQPPATTAQEVARYFAQTDLLILDGGKTEGGQPPTVVDATDPSRPVLARPGKIDWHELQTFFSGGV